MPIIRRGDDEQANAILCGLYEYGRNEKTTSPQAARETVMVSILSIHRALPETTPAFSLIVWIATNPPAPSGGMLNDAGKGL